MPTYDYRCEKGHTFEVFHGIKHDSPKTCPQCDAPAKRVPGGGGGLLFKGSGFYVTDYRSDSYKKGAKGAKGESGGSGAGEKPAGSPAEQSPGPSREKPSGSSAEKSQGSSVEKSGGSPGGPSPSGGAGSKGD